MKTTAVKIEVWQMIFALLLVGFVVQSQAYGYVHKLFAWWMRIGTVENVYVWHRSRIYEPQQPTKMKIRARLDRTNQLVSTLIHTDGRVYSATASNSCLFFVLYWSPNPRLVGITWGFAPDVPNSPKQVALPINLLLPSMAAQVSVSVNGGRAGGFLWQNRVMGNTP
jgi:hypothetical protein